MRFLSAMFAAFILVGCGDSNTMRRHTARHDADIFSQLQVLPAPGSIRAADGSPGPSYWQQRADHTITATLDVDANTITASETILYTNNSPQSLWTIHLQIDQNIHREGSVRSREGRSTGEDDHPGIVISRLMVDGADVSWNDYDTIAVINLREPIPASGGQATLDIDWTFPMPTSAKIRMGYDDSFEAGPVWELAHWFPTPFVFDDVHGWNTLPYIGRGEFYTNFGDYEVSLTVPRSHLVFGSGELTNPEDVLTETQQERLAIAMESDEVTAIRTLEEVTDPASRPEGEDPLTWRFRGDDIRTFAWATSPAFAWDAGSVQVGDHRVLCQSAYPAEAADIWDEAASYVQHAISYYSDMLAPYPWPQMTVVRGPAGGMEYPMLVYCRGSTHRGLFDVTDHEVGHNWFPMMVNSDERRHAWMDEGFNTFVNHYSTEAYYGDEEHRLDVPKYDASQHIDDPQPVNTRPDLIEHRRHLSYRKPGYGLRLLREQILGPERFDTAFREYVRRWSFKSPRPADFYRTLENAAGADLDWFWRGFFEEPLDLDQSIATVRQKEIDGAWSATLVIDNRDDWVCPLDVLVTFDDGSTQRLSIPVTVWAWTNRHEHPITTPSRISRVVIDPDEAFPDIDRVNNVWSR